METRSIAIGLVAVVAAFAAAFGVAKSGGSKTETAGAGVKAAPIQLAKPAAVAGVEVGGTIPALRAERKKAKKKASKKPAASSPATSAPSTQKTAPSTQKSAPSTQNTTAPSTQNSAPAPQVSNPAPRPSNPAPSKPSQPANNGPVSTGGEDG
jgi:hypothetical protein